MQQPNVIFNWASNVVAAGIKRYVLAETDTLLFLITPNISLLEYFSGKCYVIYFILRLQIIILSS